MHGRCFFGCIWILLLSPIFEVKSQNSDSLLAVYHSGQEGQAKLSVLHQLFLSYLNNDPVKAAEYAKAQLVYAESISDLTGIGMAYYNFGVLANNRNQFDSAAYWYQEALGFFEEADNPEKIVLVRYGLAILAYYEGDYPAALDLLEENVRLTLETQPDSSELGDEYHLMGLIHMRKGNLNIALSEALKSLRIFQKAGNQVGIADAYNSLGGIESSLGNFQKSIDYNRLSLKIYQERNDKIYEAQALNDIGNNFFYLRQYEEAVSHLLESAALSRQLEFKDLEATAYTNLGKTYTAQKEYEQAIEILLEGLKLVEETQTPIKIVEICNALGQAYQGLQNHGMAILYFNRSIELAVPNGFLEALSEGYMYRSISNERLKDLHAAFQDYKKHADLKDSIMNVAKSRQIEELRAIFELETKDNEIRIQQTAIQLLEQEAQITALQKVLLGSGLISLVLVAGFGWYAFRQKMKKTELAKKQMDAALHYKSRELTTQALHLAKKNETLVNLKEIAQRGKETDSTEGYHKLIQTISSDLREDRGWDTFAGFFEEVHPDFFSRAAASCPGLSPNDYRLMALIKMNLSSKEIANILCISIPGIKKARQRLRKKLGLDTGDSLEELIMRL
ncbi:tetratricopeptide repeat protein [Aquiflexum gelatinilyticum]|uniref:Transcriptional regulator n=1 Tax=Aquiflexum gelatinilyticum TaxID=2961943 RepID=A0A9X2P4C4_9BACT|nr:transcriptional regulator [Aquiflexum gelatinilyticum]MCR9015728.1 transcriptional regulator [Aquiflexum gelatinilyticum]